MKESNDSDQTVYCQTEYLTESNCNKTFHSLLRNNKNGNEKHSKQLPHYLFPKNVRPVVKQLPELNSHIEHYQGTDAYKDPGQAKKCRYIKDNVMFDDSYTDFNQRLHPTKKLYPQTIAQNQATIMNQNPDIIQLNLKKNTTLSQRIKENYVNNPMKWLNKEQTNKYNSETMKKMEPHSKRVADYLSSKNIQKSFLNSKSEKKFTIRPDNINSIPSSIYKTAIMQKKLEPNFSKKNLLGNRPRMPGGIFDQ